MTNPIYARLVRVRPTDIDRDARIQPVIFIDYLLESASEHAAAYGVDVTDLFRKGLTWVLSRFHVIFERYPRWGEEMEIRTWPSARLPLFAVRDYEVVIGGSASARATSSWLIVDLKTRRPVRTADHLAGFPQLDRRAVEDGFAPLPSPAREDIRKEFPVFFYDLDLNRHVTATVYIHRALETIPKEILTGFRPSSIEVNFRAETFYGEAIISRCERVERGDEADGRIVFLHRLSRASDDRELTLLRTVWSPSSPGSGADEADATHPAKK